MNKQRFLSALCVLSMFIILNCKNDKNRILPIYNPSDFVPELVEKNLQNKSEFHTVSDFNLLNQNGDTITQKDYENKIYVADFFFTTCPGICPKLTKNMNSLQESYKDDADIMLLSHSVMPWHDTVEILAEYAKNNTGVFGTSQKPDGIY